MSAPKFTVRPQGRQWAVYLGEVLVEGGFFSRHAAEAARDTYEREAA